MSQEEIANGHKQEAEKQLENKTTKDILHTCTRLKYE